MGTSWKIWLLTSLATLSIGCINLRTAGREATLGVTDGLSETRPEGVALTLRTVGHGLMEGINEEIPATTKGMMKGFGEGLRQDVLTDATNERIASTLDVAGRSATRQFERMLQLLERTLAPMAQRSEELSRRVMIGVGKGLGEGVLSDDNRDKLAELMGSVTRATREQLVGAAARDEVTAMVREVLKVATNAVDTERQRLADELKDAESRFRQAILGLIVLFVIAGGIIAFAVFQWRRHDRLVQLLTLQIDRIEDEPTRQAVKSRIQALASAGGLEPHLRKQLQKQGLLQRKTQPA